MTARRRTQSFEAEEALPEADRLEGFAHPRETLLLAGHEAAEQAFREAFDSGHMHHAWLITGPSGIGKATLAYRMARYAFAEPAERSGSGLAVDPASRAVRQVVALSHPGLLVIRRAFDPQRKRTPTAIGVDEVRRLKGFLGLSAAEDGWRVVIIDRADEMNGNAANALLKSLEEPPRRTLFLLVASEPGKLIATIHSRCRRLALAALAPEALVQAISGPLAAAGHAVPQQEELHLLVGLSGGSVRRALALASGGELVLYDRLTKLLGRLPDLDMTALLKLADELTPAAADAEFAAFTTLLQELLARLLRQRATGTGAIGAEQGLAEHLIAEPRLATWAELWETVAREKDQTLALNLDRKTFIIETFFRIAAASRQ